MTEKDYNPEQKQMKAMKKQKVASKAIAPELKTAVKKEEKILKEEKTEAPKEEETEEKKKIIEKTKVKERPKKTKAEVRISNAPISTKHSMAICNFIRNKKLSEAIEQLEQVVKFKRAIPMKGEIPHRHGKGMMSGRYPIKAVENFLKLLKSIAANADYNGLEESVITKAVANLGSRPYGKFGAVRKKRTHIEIIVEEKKKKSKEKKVETEKAEEKK